MFRLTGLATALGMGLILCTMGAANSATYCAKYVGGQERVGSGARSQCDFATLKQCRTSVRERGGGTCYKKGQLR